jgi:hypothetical protein
VRRHRGGVGTARLRSRRWGLGLIGLSSPRYRSGPGAPAPQPPPAPRRLAERRWSTCSTRVLVASLCRLALAAVWRVDGDRVGRADKFGVYLDDGAAAARGRTGGRSRVFGGCVGALPASRHRWMQTASRRWRSRPSGSRSPSAERGQDLLAFREHSRARLAAAVVGRDATGLAHAHRSRRARRRRQGAAVLAPAGVVGQVFLRDTPRASLLITDHNSGVDASCNARARHVEGTVSEGCGPVREAHGGPPEGRRGRDLGSTGSSRAASRSGSSRASTSAGRACSSMRRFGRSSTSTAWRTSS